MTSSFIRNEACATYPPQGAADDTCDGNAVAICNATTGFSQVSIACDPASFEPTSDDNTAVNCSYVWARACGEHQWDNSFHVGVNSNASGSADSIKTAVSALE